MKELHLPNNIRSMKEIFYENPNLEKFAKYFNTYRFDPLDFVIVSQPQSHPNHLIYGLFVIDKNGVFNNLKTGQKNKPVIKQDFIALDNNRNSITYFSGGSNKDTGEHQSIHAFCKKYGKQPDGSWGQYGCTENKLETNQHWYYDENDTNLPSEKYIRDLILKKLNKIKNEYSNVST